MNHFTHFLLFSICPAPYSKELKRKSDPKSENAFQTTSTLSVKFFSVPVILSRWLRLCRLPAVFVRFEGFSGIEF
jgi:hypothetical protein